MIDEFPVWNSEPDQPTMMSWAAAPEREEVSELSTEVWDIDDRSSSFYRRMEGVGAVWVVLSLMGSALPFHMRVKMKEKDQNITIDG